MGVTLDEADEKTVRRPLRPPEVSPPWLQAVFSRFSVYSVENRRIPSGVARLGSSRDRLFVEYRIADA
jgi:hypothetical protein